MKCQQMEKRIARVLGYAFVIGLSSARGDVTYYTGDMGFSPEEEQVKASVAVAAAVYNQHISVNKHWYVYYNAGIPTAQAGYDGAMGYGGQRTVRVALHEGGHTLGMGTGPNYSTLIAGGTWGGAYGQAETQATFGGSLSGDGHAIWPGGLNYEDEDGFINRIYHARIMAAMRCDMGILAYSREAENELVHPGETAEFRVASPVAVGYQWYKGGAPLASGGDISGATSPTLRIANAESADEGSYYCAATGAGETLNSRARQLWVVPAQELARLAMENNVVDSVNVNSGTAFGSPSYTAGKIGQAINLDGVDDYVALPNAAGLTKDMTVATWVNWDGGNNWQRIFDVGTGTYQYMFLTPKSGGGTLRLVFRDSIAGVNSEKIVETSVLSTGQWVHLAAVLNRDYATLYVNGQAAGSVTGVNIDPSDFQPTQNYIGKSQYNDPLFDGRVDDFRIYNHALGGPEIWDLWGQSANAAPEFTADVLVLPSAVGLEAYAGPSLTNQVVDANGDPLSFAKIAGPAWLSLAANGSVSGMPGAADFGWNRFIVRVMDPSGASSDAEIQLFVEADFQSGPVAHWDFADAGAVHDGFLPGNGSRQDLDGGGLSSSDFRIGSTDRSGNGNHLTAWTSTWMKWSSLSALGDFSMTQNGSYPAAGTDSTYNPFITGIDAEAITPSRWTVEAEFRPTTLVGNQTIVGRDGNFGNFAALYFSTRGTDLAIEYRDVAGNGHNLQVAAGLANDTWYHAAATCDGSTLRLWLNGSELGSLDVSGSADSSLARGYGTWSVSRGMWAGAGFDQGHVDRFFGYIDAVAISGVALTPGHFVITGTWPSGYDFYVDGYGIPEAPFEGDANINGIPNGMEYYLGWDPAGPGSSGPVLSLSVDPVSVTYPFNPSASDVTGALEWTIDLTGTNWTDAGVTYLTNTAPDEIEATLPTADTNQLFLRLRIDNEW